MSPNNQHRTSVAPDIERAQKPPVGARLLSSLPRQLGAAALIALMALVSTATASHAWQCIISEQAIATALCEDGVCSEGFGIDYVVTDRGCKARPVVRKLSEAGLSALARSARLSYHRHLSGIYEVEVDSFCIRHGLGKERCITPTSIRRLSERVDQQALDAYRNEWVEVERQAYQSHLSALSKTAAIVVSFTILAIGWPWTLGALIPACRRYIGWILLVAIPIQLFMGLVFWVLFAHAIGVPALWKWVGTFCTIVIVIAIPVQLGTFIRRKFKARARLT